MTSTSRILVATGTEARYVEAGGGKAVRSEGLDGCHPTCLAAERRASNRAWCGTRSDGVFRSDDGGASWQPTGLEGEHVMSVAVSPVGQDDVWVGTEPSALWHSSDAGVNWRKMEGLSTLPSSDEWSFPPRPETHHVRWIGCHPGKAGHLWLAIEAGALVSTTDGGTTWRDRVPGGPYDTHELALHPDSPDTLRVSAGDGYYESFDEGATWASPMDGLDVGYLRSVAIDPGDPSVVLVSGASGPHSAYVAGHSDGRVYRRAGKGRWRRVVAGWPEPPETIAPLLCGGMAAGELWAADERGVHRSTDGGRSWETVAGFDRQPSNLRGLAPLIGG